MCRVCRACITSADKSLSGILFSAFGFAPRTTVCHSYLSTSRGTLLPPPVGGVYLSQARSSTGPGGSRRPSDALVAVGGTEVREGDTTSGVTDPSGSRRTRGARGPCWLVLVDHTSSLDVAVTISPVSTSKCGVGVGVASAERESSSSRGNSIELGGFVESVPMFAGEGNVSVE